MSDDASDAMAAAIGLESQMRQLTERVEALEAAQPSTEAIEYRYWQALRQIEFGLTNLLKSAEDDISDVEMSEAAIDVAELLLSTTRDALCEVHLPTPRQDRKSG